MRTLTTDLDFRQHAARNLAIETRGSAPAAPKRGQVYFDETLQALRIYTSDGWVRVPEVTNHFTKLIGDGNATYFRVVASEHGLTRYPTVAIYNVATGLLVTSGYTVTCDTGLGININTDTTYATNSHRLVLVG